jgi:hypothetical protein
MRWQLETPTGDSLDCIRAVDTATHPEYQRMGIFRRLTEEAVEIARSDNVNLIFNTPNEKSRPGYIKMGWQEVGRIGALVRISRRVLQARHDDDASDAGLFLRQPKPFVMPGAATRPARGVRTPRSEAYLQWRFASHPTARYFSVAAGPGTAVVRANHRNRRRELVVADLFGPPGAGIRAVNRSTRSAYMATWFSSGSPERRAALRGGFVPIPGFTALTLVMRPLGEVPANLGSLGAWDMSVSDFELL